MTLTTAITPAPLPTTTPLPTQQTLQWVTDLTTGKEMPSWLIQINLKQFTTILTKLEIFAIELFTNKSLCSVFLNYHLQPKEEPTFSGLYLYHVSFDVYCYCFIMSIINYYYYYY